MTNAEQIRQDSMAIAQSRKNIIQKIDNQAFGVKIVTRPLGSLAQPARGSATKC